MARQSADSLSIATVSIPLRPDPPKDIPKYAQEVWKKTVDTKPPEWFEADSHPLLRAYCIHSAQHKKLTDHLSNFEIEDDNYAKVLKMITEQSKIIGELAVKMRLTQQSRYTPMAAKTASKKTASGGKPWEA